MIRRLAVLVFIVAACARGAHAGGTEPVEGASQSFRATVAEAEDDARRRGGSATDAFAIEFLDARMRRESERLGDRSLARLSPLLANDKKFGKALHDLANALELSDSQYRTVAPFIVDGSPIPSAVDLVALSGDRGFEGPFCSGTLIAARRVLTAAHCVCNGAAAFVHTGEQIQRRPSAAIRVERVNFVDSSFTCPASGRAGMTVEQATEVATRGRDLAVLEISARPPGAKPRPLLDQTTFKNWRTGPYHYFVRAAGYGFTATPTSSVTPSYGRRLYADIAVARGLCDASDASLDCVPGAELVAAGHPATRRKGPDTCGGDSGGPIYAMMQDGAKKNFYLVGVTSRGIDEDCGSGGIYALAVGAKTTAWLKSQGATVR